MTFFAMLLGLGLAGQAESAFCRNPPSRASDSYWDYVGACGCARLEAPSRASSDYDRFLKACTEWRERNPQLTVTLPDPTAGDPVTPASPPPRECQNPPSRPPSRVSESYWTFIDACGCASLTAPSRASSDHDRFVKACSDWRQRNPSSPVGVAGPSPSPRPSPRPRPSASPKASPAP